MTTIKMTTTKMLTRADILGANDLRTEVVEVPAWGGSVTVKSLTGTERDAYETSGLVWGRDDKGTPVLDSITSENMRARLVALSVVDEQGAPMFTDADVSALGRKNADALNRLFDVARRLSGLTKEDVEALTAGLKVGPSARSGSGSPANSATHP